MIKKIFSVFMLVTLLFRPVAMAAISPQIDIAKSGIVINADTLEVYWQKNPDRVMYPASITKVLTALVVLENSNLDDMVQVSDYAIDSIIGNTLWLEYGESQSVENLLHGLLMVSANDAAVALAEHVAGSVEAFAVLMNEKAESLGACNSHFVNPHGLHDPDHYTTARDMALIFKEALKNQKFLEIANCPKKVMSWYGHDEDREIFHSTLAALPYDWILANKNGYTDEAGQTLVYGGRKNEATFVAVLLDSSDIWNEMERLLLAVYESLGLQEVFAAQQDISVGGTTWHTQEELNVVNQESEESKNNFTLSFDEENFALLLKYNDFVLGESKIIKLGEEEEEFLETSWLIPAAVLLLFFWFVYFFSLKRSRG